VLRDACRGRDLPAFAGTASGRVKSCSRRALSGAGCSGSRSYAEIGSRARTASSSGRAPLSPRYACAYRSPSGQPTSAAECRAAVGREDGGRGALLHAHQVAERERGQLETEVEHLGARAPAVALGRLVELALDRASITAARLQLEALARRARDLLLGGRAPALRTGEEPRPRLPVAWIAAVARERLPDQALD